MKKNYVSNFNLVTYINQEQEKEKRLALEKKVLENEALRKTLIQNEENKKLQAIARDQQRYEDIRSAEEYTRVLEKQENERKAYFKNIEMKANNFLSKIGKTVLKEIEEKNRQEEEKMKKYLEQKEERTILREKQKLEEIRLQKLNMRSFLDKQVEEKRRQKEFDKYLNSAQANIWNTDIDVAKEQENMINEKIKKMNEYNHIILKTQMENKKAKNNPGMTDSEYLMNRDLLEKAARNLNN